MSKIHMTAPIPHPAWQALCWTNNTMDYKKQSFDAQSGWLWCYIIKQKQYNQSDILIRITAPTQSDLNYFLESRGVCIVAVSTFEDTSTKLALIDLPHKIIAKDGNYQLLVFVDGFKYFFMDDNYLSMKIKNNAPRKAVIEGEQVSFGDEVSRCVEMFKNLPTITETKTISLGSTLLNKLTNEDKKIATDKGWTLA